MQRRYLTIWQPPVAHFKNLAVLPGMIRIGCLLGSLADLARHANCLDCHTPFSSNSMSLVLALAVGGWDPDWVSDDWHMMAKCSAMTEGRVKCESILLPMINLVPEEEGCCKTLQARFTQAKRHALGVSEVVYLASSIYLGLLEAPSIGRRVKMLWRTMPLLGKFIELHVCGALLPIWTPVSVIFILFTNMLEGADTTLDQIVSHSMLSHYQRILPPAIMFMIFMLCTVAVMYFNMLKHRTYHSQWIFVKYTLLFWLRSEFEMLTMGFVGQVIFGTLPEFIAATRIVFQLKIDHAVAAMLGRTTDDADGDGV